MSERSTLLMAFTLRAFSGYCLALPLIGAVASSGIGAVPRADRALFEPGGLFLLELLRQQGPALAQGARVGVLLWPLAAAASAFGSSALFQAALRPELELTARLRRALAQTPGFLWVGVLELLGAALLALAALLAGGAAANIGSAALGEPGPELAAAAVVLAALAAFGWLSILGELARGELALAGGSPHAALRRGLAHFRPKRAELVAGYLFALGVGALAVALAARVVELCDVGRPGHWRLATVLVVHALVLFWLTLLQAGWTLRVATTVAAAELSERPREP